MTTLPPPPPGALMTLLPPPDAVGPRDDERITGGVRLPPMPRLASAPIAVEPAYITGSNAVTRHDQPTPITGSVLVVPTETFTPRGVLVSKVFRPMRSTAVFGVPMLVAYITTVACLAVLALLSFRAHELLSAGAAGAAELGDIDRMVPAVLAVMVIAIVGSGVLTSMWAGRVAENLRSAGVHANTAAARIGWFVPIWCYVAPFRELRKTPAADGAVRLWQWVFIGNAVASFVIQMVMRSTADPNARYDTWSDGIAHGRLAITVLAATLALALVAAALAVAAIGRTFLEIETARRVLVQPPLPVLPA